MSETKKAAAFDALPRVDCDPGLSFEPIPGVTVASAWPCRVCGQEHARLLVQREPEIATTVYYRIDCFCGEPIYYTKVTYLTVTDSDQSVRVPTNIHMKPAD